MQVTEHPDGSVETRHVPRGLPLALGALGAILLVLAALAVPAHPAPALVLALLSLAALVESWNQRLPSRFRFEPESRVVRWRIPARFGLGLKEGECGFDRVRQVVLQAGPGRGAKRLRVALLLHEGPPPVRLALSRDFSLDQREAAPIAARLREMIGLESAQELHARVLAEVRSAGEAAAVALLRREAGLTEKQAEELTAHLIARED